MQECQKAGTQYRKTMVRSEYIIAGLEALIQAEMVSLWGEGGMRKKSDCHLGGGNGGHVTVTLFPHRERESPSPASR